MPGDRTLFGKYRGTVTAAIDPLMSGRVQVVVPALGPAPVWAVACLPYFGGTGLLALPSPGAAVWVEFEGGDPDLPIWSGGRIDAPVTASPGSLTLCADGARITLSASSEPKLTVTTDTGATITVGAAGITVSNGSGATIQLSGPSVILNGGALDVT